jgi:phosphatidylglycerophosphate synthase
MRTSRLLFALPNALSAARLALGLGFPWLPPPWQVVAVVLAALSDVADGAVSRRYRLASTTGRILDPLADKVFVLSAAGTFVLAGSLGPWEIVLLALRDVGVLIRGSLGLFRRGWPAVRLMAPTPLGKATTVMQFVFLLTLLTLGRPTLAVFVPTALLSGLAGADYLRLALMTDRGNRPT